VTVIDLSCVPAGILGAMNGANLQAPKIKPMIWRSSIESSSPVMERGYFGRRAAIESSFEARHFEAVSLSPDKCQYVLIRSATGAIAKTCSG
jgi:hypothetical protein